MSFRPPEDISDFYSSPNRAAKIPKKRREKVFKRDNYKCLICGSKENLTIDHIVPKSKGGSRKQSNLQTLCFDCNQKKGNN